MSDNTERYIGYATLLELPSGRVAYADHHQPSGRATHRAAEDTCRQTEECEGAGATG